MNNKVRENNSQQGFFGIRMSSWCHPMTAPPVVTNVITTKAGEAMT